MAKPEKVPDGPYRGKFPASQMTFWKVLFGSKGKHKKGSGKKKLGKDDGYHYP